MGRAKFGWEGVYRNRRLERFAWVLLALAVGVFFFGKEALVREALNAAGYVGAAVAGALGAAVIFLNKRSQSP